MAGGSITDALGLFHRHAVTQHQADQRQPSSITRRSRSRSAEQLGPASCAGGRGGSAGSGTRSHRRAAGEFRRASRRTSTPTPAIESLCGGVLIAFTAAAWAHRNVIDDGRIYFRVVQQIAVGHGPSSLHAGERVEAFTSPLWLGVLTLGPRAVAAARVVRGRDGHSLHCHGTRSCRDRVRVTTARNCAGVRPRSRSSLVVAVLAPMWLYAVKTGLEKPVSRSSGWRLDVGCSGDGPQTLAPCLEYS